AVSSICGVSYSAAGDQGENGHHACGYGRAAGQEALGGVVVASAVQEHLHQDQDACGAASVFNGARIALGQGGPSVLHPASRSPVSVLSDWPAMRDRKELPGPPAEARMTNAGSVREFARQILSSCQKVGRLGSEFNAPLRSKLSLAKASARHLQQTPPELSMAAFSEKHTLLRASVILTCIGFVCYLQFPVLGCSDPPSLLTSSLCHAASGKAHQAFRHHHPAAVLRAAAFILLAAFVEPTLINQSATSWAAWGATCSALSGILLLQATGTQHTQKLLTSNERGDEEGNQHGQLLGFIHKDVGRHHDDGGNIEQASTATAWPPAPPQKKLVYSSRQKPITLKKKASFSHLLLEAENARHSRDDRADQAVRSHPGGRRRLRQNRRAVAPPAGQGRPPQQPPPGRPASVASLHRNNNKCCNGVGGRNGNMMADAALMEALVDSHNTSADDFNREGSIDPTVETGSPIDDADFDEGDCGGAGMKYPKHQDYCLCHKRKCKKCGCLCPCSEHACPGCGYSSRVVMTMRAVDGLKEIANAQKARFRNGRMATIGRCRPRGKRFLFRRERRGQSRRRVLPRRHGPRTNKVVLSKFTRGDGSAFLSPWRPYYAGPLRKGRPRGIRYVD
uniref:CRC domain-containing protein n=1 Tax=Macrostomum lignano TaxID=282301 RepID=A0A1I8FPY8_9PLAT